MFEIPFQLTNLYDMSVTLPTASAADTASNAAIAAATTAAQAAFVASTTVLINQAIGNGLFRVQPFLPILITAEYVTSYFQPLGYAVLFPICSNCCTWQECDPCLMPANFPEVLPPGFIPWNCCPGFQGPVRIQISWPSQ